MTQRKFIHLFISVICLCTALTSAQQYTSLFNGQNLDGWTVLGNGSWQVQDGAIIAAQPASEPDFTHLVHDTTVDDFEITFLFKNPKGNAGFFFRMEQTSPRPAGVSGVQVVIDVGKNDNTMFGFYETNGRGWLQQWSYSSWNSIFDASDWNRLTIIAEGTRLLLKLNMRTIVDIEDPMGRTEGKIAFKLHSGRDGEAHFKDIKIRPVYHGLDLPFLKVNLEKAFVYAENNTAMELRGYLKQMAREQDFVLDELNNSNFTQATLADYQAALFLGDNELSFTGQQRQDFEAWAGQGNGVACIGACAGPEISAEWPWWSETLGQTLDGKTGARAGTARVDADGQAHPITQNLDQGPWEWTEEWPHFDDNPRNNERNTVLVLADPENFQGNTGNTDPEYPIGWMSESDGGKMFYYGAFNTTDGLSTPFHYDLFLNAIQYTAGFDTVRTGCMDPGYEEYNPYATISEPEACQTPSLVKAPGIIAKSIHIRGRQFSVSLKGNYTVRITDAQGRQLRRSRHVGNSEHDLSSLSNAGIVFLQVRVGSVQVTKPLVVL